MPRLSVDRPFTYLLPEDAGAGVGSLVSVPFHGRTVRAWVLGPASELPEGPIAGIRKVRSPVRFFDERMLALLRWVSERYIAPLATVIDRSHPPRVVSEEALVAAAVDGGVPSASRVRSADSSPAYAPPPVAAVFELGKTTWLRPLPGAEAEECLRAVDECLGAGRQALVLVPEAEPLPATAGAVLERFAGRAGPFLGGDARGRYRTWLDIRAGRFDVVVATRPGVFAPLENLGLIWISRETHPGHREDRSPYYHVREVAGSRARLEGGACVLSSYSPSAETVTAADAGLVRVLRPPRQAERQASPLVETVQPEPEDRSARLAALLKRARSAALIISRRGYGIARVCRSCGEPAACATCAGPIVAERGAYTCGVCGAPGRCRNCAAGAFGLERRGTERMAEWASHVSPLRVDLENEGEAPPAPGAGRILVGTAAAVKDAGPVRLDLVAVLDPDRALARPGVRAGERALATWMEAAAWAAPRHGGGRVLVQTRRPAHPAIQALVRWDPVPFLRGEAARRGEAGFPPNHPVFRIVGDKGLPGALRGTHPASMLTTATDRGTLCLVTVRSDDLSSFRREVLRLAAAGTVARVEAEPQL